MKQANKTEYKAHYFLDNTGKTYLGVTYSGEPVAENILARGCEETMEEIRAWGEMTLALHRIHPKLCAPNAFERLVKF